MARSGASAIVLRFGGSTRSGLPVLLTTADLRLSVLVDAETVADQACSGGCERPPAPGAWWMEPSAPSLTQRMLDELSPSPTKATED